ncbi:MAG: hypothetical protein CVU39_14500 [Chloroflexi bacterium HGW-Chloroflexi-10]|nr:MAG: hypothetical protein CVU39_14500 [Chloroflexi bacterium HGW-Chloroflexi-10]
MSMRNEIDPELSEKLAYLQTEHIRNPEKEALGLAAFLMKAQESAEAITPSQKQRLNKWMHSIQSIFMVQRKEQSPMLSTLSTIVLIAALILGGGGATVAASQGSLPDQPLYGVKLISEDVRLGFSSNPESEYQLALKYSDRRAAEIQKMLIAGGTLPEAVQNRYENQVEQAFQYAMNLPDDQAAQALEQIRTRLQTQEQTFLQLRTNGSATAELVMLRTQQMLQDRLHWVETGLLDPAQLREQLRLRQLLHLASVTPSGETTTPATGGGNPWTTGTPTPGSGYGPGNETQTCENCTPVFNGQGGNPWTSGTPTPGSGYGPGPGPDPTQTCTANADSGSEPTQEQGGQPTQAVPQPTEETPGEPGEPGGKN